MSEKTEALKGNIVKYAKLFKLRWKTPADGYDVSYKELTAATGVTMGHGVVLDVTQYVEMAATSAVISMIFAVSFTYIYIIGLMASIVSYIFTGLNVQVLDNLGKVPKGIFRTYTIGTIVALAAAISIALSNWSFLIVLDSILPYFMWHVVVVIVARALPIYLNMIILRLFGKKWGKFKPWFVLMGVPTALCAVGVAYIPYDSLTPNNLLLAVSIVSNLMSGLRINYTAEYLAKFQALLTCNRQERVFLNSFFPVLGGVLTSLTGMIINPLATLLGYEANSIEIYRIILPIFSVIGLIPTACILLCHERTIVAKSHVAKIDPKKAFVAAISNKYLWITKLYNVFAEISTFTMMILSWTILYQYKMQWLSWITVIATIPATPANLITPFLTRKYSSRSIVIIMKSLQTISILSCLLIIKIQTPAVVITLLLLACGFSTLFSKPAQVINNACVGDAWDYHQWKHGERMEGATEYIGYVTIPMALGLGYMTPFLYEKVGFIGDYDIMYDSVMRQKVFTIHILLFALEVFMCMTPYFFYDLTPEKHKQMMQDLRDRAAAEDEQMRLQEEGLTATDELTATAT
ncbi:MAG: MFS transporter [Bacillota bacterium]